MATTPQLLGKLETVFSYTAPFFLHSWPQKYPGALFLTDATGTMIKSIPLQPDQIWEVPVSETSPNNEIRQACGQVVQKALTSGKITTHMDAEGQSRMSWAVVPLNEKNGRPRATIGIVVACTEMEIDLVSYIKGMEALIMMGYDAYIHQVASDIVMNANRYERSINLVKSVIEKVDEIVDKGFCSAIKLDERGFLLPQERLTAGKLKAKGAAHVSDILPSLIDKPIEAAVSDDNKLVLHPIYGESRPLCVLLLHIPNDEEVVYDERDIAFLRTVGDKVSFALQRALDLDEIHLEVKKKDLLYQLTKKIQASIDVNDVLAEIMSSIEQLYPFFTVDLYLTVETNTNLPVKSLSFQSADEEFSNQAYIEGHPVVGTQMKDDQQVTILATPLLGKQGIYGVLQLTTTRLVNLNENETEYISILAETAGTAFENAQLYQQSRNRIRELRLINEMAQQLNRSLKLDEILQFVTKMLLGTFEAEYCAILRRAENQEILRVMAASKKGDIGRTVQPTEKPICDVIQEKRSVILANPTVETMPFSLVPFASLMAVPLLQESEVTGVILVSDARRHFFSFEDFKLLEIFGQHTSLAITNALLHSEVERMVITDNLTGLYARRFLNERVQESLEQDGFGSLILIDIDFFKKVNDTYGHQVGDEILIKVAVLIKHSIRDSDIPARWGGEEIAVYLPRVDISAAVVVAERMRKVVETDTTPPVTISIGVAKWDKAANMNLSVEALFQEADMALYEAKRNGRNQVRVI